jgi:hypothetical protein
MLKRSGFALLAVAAFAADRPSVPRAGNSKLMFRIKIYNR